MSELTNHNWDSMINYLEIEIGNAQDIRIPQKTDVESRHAQNYRNRYIKALEHLNDLILNPNTYELFINRKEIIPNLSILKPVIEVLVAQNRLDGSILDR